MSRLPVSKMFVENAQGKLQAKFRMERDPEYTEKDGVKHYWIDLCYIPEKDRAKAIDDVTFYVDEAYRDRVRLANKERDGSYTATIPSYGDFVITVEVTINGMPYRQQMWLSDMLEAGYPAKARAEAVDQVIRELRDN